MTHRIVSRLVLPAFGAVAALTLALPVSLDTTSGLPSLKAASAMTITGTVAHDGIVYREAGEGARGEGQGGNAGPGSGGNGGNGGRGK
ncbi:MAG: hypothetical protein U1F33_00970 [Alphaproteobacteria bacterium]